MAIMGMLAFALTEWRVDIIVRQLWRSYEKSLFFVPSTLWSLHEVFGGAGRGCIGCVDGGGEEGVKPED